MKHRLFYPFIILAFSFLILSTTLAPRTVYAAAPAPVSPPTLSCPTTVLSWAICPVIDGIAGAVGGLDDFINKQMSIGTPGASDDPNQIFCDSSSTGNALTSCDAYHKAWVTIRNLALGLMVIAGLIALIAQSLGLELLDAYTIRKALPRLLISAVAITLSWQLMQFAVTFSNDLAFGVRILIYQPFAGLHAAALTGGSQFIGSLLSLGALTALGWIGLLSFVGTALIAVFLGVLVLVLRQLLIIMLIIFAPIAIVSYILPNTQRIYKLWWESFSKALLMFALISAMIAIGRVFSAVSSLNSTSPIDELAGFAAYFLPYFLIPFAFKMSGTAMSSMAGFVNARGEGARGALRNVRGNRVKENMGKLQAGTRFEGKKWIPGSIKAATKFGDVSRGVGTGWNGRFGVGRRGENAQANALQAAGEAALKEPGMQAIKGKNDFNRVLIEGMGDERRGKAGLIKHLTTGGDDGQTFLSTEEATARADAAVIGAKVAGGFTKAHGVAAFKNMARDGTALRDTEDLARLAALAGDGNAKNTFDYAAEATTVSKQVGRPGLAPSTESIGDLANRQSDKLFNNGNARLYTGNKDDQKLITDSRFSAYGNTQPYERFTQSKGRDLRSDHKFLADVVSDTTGKYSPDEKQTAAAHMADARAAIASGLGAGNKREEAAKAMAPAIEAHDQYMKQETGGTRPEEATKKVYVETAPGVTEERVTRVQGEREERNSDVVQDRFGGRPSQQGMTPEQIAEEANRNRPEEPDQQ